MLGTALRTRVDFLPLAVRLRFVTPLALFSDCVPSVWSATCSYAPSQAAAADMEELRFLYVFIGRPPFFLLSLIFIDRIAVPLELDSVDVRYCKFRPKKEGERSSVSSDQE